MPYKIYLRPVYSNELYHHGIKGQKWGVRRFQNPDGTLTARGRARYSKGDIKYINKFEADMKRKGWKTESRSTNTGSPDITMKKDITSKIGNTITALAYECPGEHGLTSYDPKRGKYWEEGAKKVRAKVDDICKKATSNILREYDAKDFGMSQDEFKKNLGNPRIWAGDGTGSGTVEVLLSTDWGGYFEFDYDFKTGKITPAAYND